MKNLTRLGGIIVIGAAIVILAGCATSVPIKSVRPPTIDTGDIQRLAIKPFENKSGVGGSFGAQITTYLTDKAMQMVPSFGYFTIVASSDPNAEGVFTGEIRNLEARDSQEQRQRKDKDGNVINYIMYKRDVSLEFQYSVISSRTGMPVGIVSKQGSTSSSAEQQSRLTDPLTLAKSIVDSQLRQLQRDIVPTIVSTSRKLMAETSKDKIVKQLMREAQALVKNGNYAEAIRQYDKISDEHGSVAARTNAGILRESVASDISARAELTALFNNTSGLPERAAKGAVDALNSRLPAGANIMIAITSSTERNMLDYVVDQMTKTVVQAGRLRVVERSSLALINAEQQYQASGNVSDDSFVSIGRQLGAQYIVLCGISGVMSNRRLTLRVLNVETAQVIDQKDFEI
jgi:hypothetical protein